MGLIGFSFQYFLFLDLSLKIDFRFFISILFRLDFLILFRIDTQQTSAGLEKGIEEK